MRDLVGCSIDGIKVQVSSKLLRELISLREIYEKVASYTYTPEETVRLSLVYQCVDMQHSQRLRSLYYGEPVRERSFSDMLAHVYRKNITQRKNSLSFENMPPSNDDIVHACMDRYRVKLSAISNRLDGKRQRRV